MGVLEANHLEESLVPGNHLCSSVHALTTFVMVPVGVTDMMEHYDQKQVGMERFIWLILPPHGPSLKEVVTGTQAGLEPEGRS